MKGSDHRMGEKFKKKTQAMLGDFCIRDSRMEAFLFSFKLHSHHTRLAAGTGCS